jgi:hypothetical protein
MVPITTPCHSPEDPNLNFHHCENFKCCIFCVTRDDDGDESSSSSSSSSGFRILGLVTCYDLMPVFDGSSQRCLSIWLVTGKYELDS